MNQNFDAEEFYVTNDADFLASIFTTNLAFLGINWRQMLGRPTITIVATHNHLGNSATNTLPNEHFLIRIAVNFKAWLEN